MIVDERLVTYINSLNRGNTEILNQIEREAQQAHVPIIRRDMQSFLRFLLALYRPAKILEVGTAVGFSALFMAEYNPAECTITTIEHDLKRISAAQENFRRAGMSHKITLLKGDAAKWLEELDNSYDLIFMDAAKGQYVNFLPDALRLLKDSGVLVSDNVLFDGEIMESRYAVARRNRTIHKRMRAYLYEVTHRDDLTTSVLPVGDGIAVSVRREAKTSDKSGELKRDGTGNETKVVV